MAICKGVKIPTERLINRKEAPQINPRTAMAAQSLATGLRDVDVGTAYQNKAAKNCKRTEYNV
jgi:hypothetical protein